MPHKNRMYKDLANTTSQNKSCLLCRLKPRYEKDAISAGLISDFMPQPTIHRLFKQSQRKKIKKAILCALKCLWISKARKTEITMDHKNRMYKHLADTASQNKSCFLLRFKSSQEKDAISAGRKQDFMPQPTMHRLWKQWEKTKINKAMLSALKCLWISKGSKSETTMAHRNRMYKYLADTTSQNISCLLRRLKHRQEKDAISAGFK